MTTPKKTQQSILTFAVKTPPFTFVHRPSPPRKRQLMEKRGPGRPKKKLREEDWRQKWYDAAESESYSSIGVWEYEAAIINYHTADENSRAPILPKKMHATYTAERKFEIREFTLANRMYSYQQIADAFRMPKTTVFDIINRKSSGEPAKGRGNKKGGGWRLSYSQETEEQLVQWVLEMRNLHLSSQ